MLDQLKVKLKNLSESAWDNRARWTEIEEWLGNFAGTLDDHPSEKLHALYLLSNFMYFGSREMRELLKSLFRDLYRYPIVEGIRRANGDTTDITAIGALFREELMRTRFLGVGNPSESGTHLLYYFRQENRLPKTLFIHSHEIFRRYGAARDLALRWPEVTRYVFIDDLCGSGQQASSYSRDIIEDLKRLNPGARASYYVIFATSTGIEEIRRHTRFDDVDAVYELDATFKCLEPNSRIFARPEANIERLFARTMVTLYGERLLPGHALGYRDSQLLLGFHHNTPDNTLPIMWCDEAPAYAWTPIFRRYPKQYGWGL